MKPKLLIFLCLISTVFLHRTALAAFISPSDTDATFVAVTPLNPSIVTYDGNSDSFMIEQTLGGAESPYSFFESLADAPGNPTANDFVGSFSLQATIDDAGVFSGGSFSLVGSSVSLGIGADTIVLSGDLTSFYNGLDEALDGVQFVSTSFAVDPALTAVFGPLDFLLIHQCCVPTDGFGASFGPIETSSEGPELFGAARSIPEPSSIAMLALGLGGLGFAARRRARG